MKTRRELIQGVGTGLTGQLLTRGLPWVVGGSALLWPRRAEAAITLNPADPSNFTQEGGQTFTAGNVLTLNDLSISDFIAFFAADPDASPGTDVDVVATFQVREGVPIEADVGNRVVINDGLIRSAIAACIIKNGINGIGLLSQGSPTDPAAYPVFVPVDFQRAPVTIRLRRAATGDAELVEVNGVAPTPRALLAANLAPGPTRTFPSFEFGCAGVLETVCVVEYSVFRSERVVQPVAGTLSFTRFRLRDSDSVDRIQLRADYTLGTGSNGINPAVEPVTIQLSTPGGGQFYPSPDFNPLNGFDVQGAVGKRRWTLNDAERLRTGIERCNFDEHPMNSGSVFLRDFRTNLADANFSTVNVEITIGTGAAEDKLTGTVNLVEKPLGSGRWRLD
jgi:hypothetical protein